MAETALGLAMNHTHSASLIPLGKKTTTVSDRSHTLKQMYSSFAFPSPPPHLSRMSARSGFPKSDTTVLACRVSLLEHKLIYEMTLR